MLITDILRKTLIFSHLRNNILFAFCLPLSAFCFLSVPAYANSSQNNDVIAKYKHLSHRQLLDTADYYLKSNNYPAALVCYSLIINTPTKETDLEKLKSTIDAYNKMAVIYYYMCDYRSAYDFLIKALFLSEKYNYDSFLPKIFTNIGNIYFSFAQYDLAELYYSKALDLCHGDAVSVVVLSNLGAINAKHEKTDSAFYFLSRALEISRQHNNIHICNILNNVASCYQQEKQIDSAFHHFRLSLNEARKHHKTALEAQNLSDLSKLFFEIRKTDSALHYINLSNSIAEQNNFLKIRAENHLTLSKIEEAKGRIKSAFEHYKIYADLKDSVFNVDQLGNINQLQQSYETLKTDQQIEQLVLEQEIKEHTIRYQRIIWITTSFILLLVTTGLVYISLQKRNLSRAYKVLFEKNLEIINLQENPSKIYSEKVKKNTLNNEVQDEILDRILALMENTSIICDPQFSINMLAGLVNSNHIYVSQVINNVLKKNFRSFLNDYRIREAQRLFSEPDAAKYTIESVALDVGFKSKSSFYDAFKEITGITPNFYLKAMQEQRRGA